MIAFFMPVSDDPNELSGNLEYEVKRDQIIKLFQSQ